MIYTKYNLSLTVLISIILTCKCLNGNATSVPLLELVSPVEEITTENTVTTGNDTSKFPKKTSVLSDYRRVVENLLKLINEETRVPSQGTCNQITEDKIHDVTIVSRKKLLTSLLYKKPSTWRRCTRSCVTSRLWKCSYAKLCSDADDLREEAWCYINGSKCEKTILKELQKIQESQTNNNDDYYYDEDVTLSTSGSSDTTPSNDYDYLYILGEEYDEGKNKLDEDTNGYDDNFYVDEDSDERGESTTELSTQDYDIDVDNVVLERKRRPGEVKCGIPKMSLQHDYLRVIGGHEAPRGALPWHVAVLNRFKEVFCGGAIIAPNWVLTAAHCIRKKLYIRIAEHDIRAYDDGEIEIKVSEMFPHPLYNLATINNDIALLKLPDDVKFGKYVRTICLPSQNQLPPLQKKCIVAGWGKERETHIFGSDVLLYAKVPVSTKKVCKNAYPDHPMSRNMFCAGYKKGGQDTCSGDSGGPLICQDKNDVWTVHGITSFGEGCGDKGKMGVYSKVHNFLPWIYHTMQNN